jgi:hypothetical protein
MHFIVTMRYMQPALDLSWLAARTAESIWAGLGEPHLGSNLFSENLKISDHSDSGVATTGVFLVTPFLSDSTNCCSQDSSASSLTQGTIRRFPLGTRLLFFLSFRLTRKKIIFFSKSNFFLYRECAWTALAIATLISAMDKISYAQKSYYWFPPFL